MFVEVGCVLRGAVGEVGAHGDVVDGRDVLHVLAQAEPSGVRAHGHLELRGEQQNGQHFVEATHTAGVGL